MRRTLARLGGLAVASSLILGACGSSASTAAPSAAPTTAPGATTAPAASEASTEPVNLEFWYWAESDAPGADKWMAETVAEYKKVKPNVTVNVVPQSADTLISAFQTAAASKSGPDIASQWATGPVLSFVWSDSIAPISDLVPADEMSHWLNTNENTYDGKVWAMPQYLLGIGLAYNKAAVRAGRGHAAHRRPLDMGRVRRRFREAQGSRDHPVRGWRQERLSRRMVVRQRRRPGACVGPGPRQGGHGRGAVHGSQVHRLVHEARRVRQGGLRQRRRHVARSRPGCPPLLAGQGRDDLHLGRHARDGDEGPGRGQGRGHATAEAGHRGARRCRQRHPVDLALRDELVAEPAGGR